jgi:serine/threonine protein kinase
MEKDNTFQILKDNSGIDKAFILETVLNPNTTLEIVKTLGKGSFGTAYLVKDPLDNFFILKKINLSKSTKNPLDSRSVIHEAQILEQMSLHFQCPTPTALCLVDSAFNENGQFIFFTNVLGGQSNVDTVMDLGVFINKLKSDYTHFKFDSRLTFNNALAIFTLLIKQLHVLHSNRIAHGDLKPENVIIQINTEGVVVNCIFIDYGEACNTKDCFFTGTIQYTSPELLGKNRSLVSFTDVIRNDVFSLGITLFELLHLLKPYPLQIDFDSINPLSPTRNPLNFVSTVASSVDSDSSYNSSTSNSSSNSNSNLSFGNISRSSSNESNLSDVPVQFPGRNSLVVDTFTRLPQNLNVALEQINQLDTPPDNVMNPQTQIGLINLLNKYYQSQICMLPKYRNFTNHPQLSSLSSFPELDYLAKLMLNLDPISRPNTTILLDLVNKIQQTF